MLKKNLLILTSVCVCVSFIFTPPYLTNKIITCTKNITNLNEIKSLKS